MKMSEGKVKVDAMFLQAYPWALRSAGVRSAAAVARRYVPLADREDLEQGATIRVWQALSSYDASRAGLRTFLEVVIRRQFTSMLRTRRRVPQFESLNDQNFGGDGGLREMELRTDVRRVLATVRPFDRGVALSLTEYSASETSAYLGVSRAAVYRAIERLRTIFSEAGLSPGAK